MEHKKLSIRRRRISTLISALKICIRHFFINLLTKCPTKIIHQNTLNHHATPPHMITNLDHVNRLFFSIETKKNSYQVGIGTIAYPKIPTKWNWSAHFSTCHGTKSSSTKCRSKCLEPRQNYENKNHHRTIPHSISRDMEDWKQQLRTQFNCDMFLWHVSFGYESHRVQMIPSYMNLLFR
jgi:hypothetical protein